MVLLSWQRDTAEGWDVLSAIWLSFALPQLHFAAAAAWLVSHHLPHQCQPCPVPLHGTSSLPCGTLKVLYFTRLIKAFCVLNCNHIFSEFILWAKSGHTYSKKILNTQEATEGRAHCVTLSHLCRIPLLGELRVYLPIPPVPHCSLPPTPTNHFSPSQPGALGSQQVPPCCVLCSLPHFSHTGGKTFAVQPMNSNIWPLLLGYVLLKNLWGQFSSPGLLSGKSNHHPPSNSSPWAAFFCSGCLPQLQLSALTER